MTRFCLAAMLPTVLALCFSAPVPSQQSASRVQVPSIGCDADGQVGWVNAPKEHPVAINLPPSIADKLAYYKGPHTAFGVLAPKGWHCFENYGSGGETLYVAPYSFQADLRYSKTWKGFTGPVIELEFVDGGTSGRFGVAKAIARFFPDFKEFTRQVVAERIMPAREFDVTPFPGETLTYRSNKMVEFRTPGNMDGSGTGGRLLKSASPVDGVIALYGDEPSIAQISIRLAAGDRDLERYIVRRFETEASR